MSDLTLVKLILSEAARGTAGPRRETSEPRSPSGKFDHVRNELGVSELRGLSGASPASFNAAQIAERPADGDGLVADMIELARAIWPLWLLPDRGLVAGRWLAGQ